MTLTMHHQPHHAEDVLPPSATGALQPSYAKWIHDALDQEDAARMIQVFVKDKMHMSTNSSLLETVSTGSVDDEADEGTKEVADDDDDTQSFTVFLWHGSHLGLQFTPSSITGFPCVDHADGNTSLPGMWNVRPGDFLLSINDCSTNQDSMAFETVMDILEDGVRPAILRFRRPRIHEMQSRSAVRRHSLTFGAAPFSMSRMNHQKRREMLEKTLSYVVWREEDGPLGLVLVPDESKPHPVVSRVQSEGVISRNNGAVNSVTEGDFLLSINHIDVSQLGFNKTMQMLQFAPKPLVLTFRHAAQPAAERLTDL